MDQWLGKKCCVISHSPLATRHSHMSPYSSHLQVAAAVISNKKGEILIARRHDHLHQGGLWEFPGGKIELGETAREALSRELHEELGIDITVARPLIRIPHTYPDRKVLLDVWRVERFEGEAHGREGQAVKWVEPDSLPGYPFPAANLAIIKAARLPDRYLITPEPGDPEMWKAFLVQLEQVLARGLRLVQFRAKGLTDEAYLKLGREVNSLCSAYNAKLLLNGKLELVDEIGAQGVHLTSTQLMGITERPLPENYWIAASTHSREELNHACRVGLDFVVASPVRVTRSHPDAEPIGWEGFLELTEASTIPVYALGGMKAQDIGTAWEHGGQGIAAIRGLWT